MRLPLGAAMLLGASMLSGCGGKHPAEQQRATTTVMSVTTPRTSTARSTTAPATTTVAPSPRRRSLIVGAVEDEAKYAPTDSVAHGDMDRARSAGFAAIAFSAFWHRGLTRLPPNEVDGLRRAARAALADSITPIVDVAQFSGDTPLSETEQDEFAAFASSVPRLVPQVDHIVVGNEPNTNLFWLPQFDAAGGDAAATSYERLLAKSYDAIKAVSPDIEVIGGGLAARGSDRPGGKRPTHSPTAFIRDLGAAYRASGRTRPLLDAFSMHVYGASSRIPPTVPHPRGRSIGIADYDKLERLLENAFGREVPIVYGEYGVNTTIAQDRLAAYTGSEVPTKHPVDPAVQASFYASAIRLAACQPLVEMLLFFHVTDEPQLERFQTGLYYADRTPKPGLEVVARAARAAALGGRPC